MADFDFQIKADPKQANDAIGQVEDGLKRVAKRSEETGRFISSSMSAGTKNAAGQFNAVEAGAKQATAAVDAMTASVGEVGAALGLAFGAHEMEAMADDYAQLSNRLRTLASDQANLNGLMDATFQIAQETRTAWDDVGNVYNRLSKSASDMGLSQKQLLGITEELSMATKISGASQSEAAMAMYELTHAFAIGTLTGREFRVLAKDMPGLLSELAKAAGMTRSEFVELGMRGHVTAKMLVDELGKAAPEIRRQFENAIPTIADSLTTVHNAATKFFGEMAQGTGIMRSLTDAIKFVADNFAVFAKVGIAVVQVFGAMFIVEKVIALLRLLGAALLANPVGIFVTALAIGVALLRQFGDEMDSGAQHTSKISAVLEVLWEDVKRLGDAIYEFLSGVWHDLTSAFSSAIDTDSIKLSFYNILIFIGSFVDAAVGALKFLKDHAAESFGALAIAVGEVFIKIGQKIAQIFEDIVNGAIDAANYIGNAIYDKLNNTDEKRKAAQDTARAESIVEARAEISKRAIAQGDTPVNIALSQPDLVGFTQARMDEIQKQNTEMEYQIQGLDKSGHGIRENQYSHVYLHTNEDPLAGAMEDVKKFTSEGIKQAMEETTVRDYIANVFVRAASIAQGKTSSTVSDKAGVAGASPVTKAEEEAMRKLENELRSVMEASNPVTSATEKLAHAQDIVNQSVTAGLISWAQGATVMENYREKLKDALDPVGAIIDKITEHTSVLRANADEQARASALLTYQNEAKQKGVVLTEAQLKELTRLIAYEQDQQKLMTAEQQFYAEIIGPQEKYQLSLRALNVLWDDGTISQEQYNRAIDKQRLAYLNASGEARTFAGGVEVALLKIKDDATNVGAAIEKVFTDVFSKIEDAIVELVVKGTTDWRAMVEAIESDMVRLLLRQGENALFGGATQVAQGASTGAAIGGAMTTAGAAVAAAIGGAIEVAGDAAALAMGTAIETAGATSAVTQGVGAAAGGATMAAFATGGSFVVGGAGGVDSQVVAFRASPGEQVSVRNPTKGQPADERSGSPTVINNHIHMEPRELLSAIDGPDFEERVANIAVKATGGRKLRSRKQP